MAIVFNIGMFDKDTHKQELDKVDFIKAISDKMDCTITDTVGVYTHDDGSKVIEPSLEITSYDKTLKQAIEIAKQLCKELNQETIIVSEKEVNAHFIG